MHVSDQEPNNVLPIVDGRLTMDAYDGAGRLLLKAGARVSHMDSLERLLKSDVRFVEPGAVAGLQTEVAAEPLSHSADKITSHQTFAEKLGRAKEIRQVTAAAMARMFERIERNGHVALEEARETVSPMIDSIVSDPRAMLSLVSLKDADAYTFTHSVNVAILALSLAVYLDTPREILNQLGIGALMHDIGKTSIPSAILHKPAALSEQEMKVIRRHPLEGAKVLAKSGGYTRLSIETVLDHHENVLGTGYPYGKMRPQISKCAQITSITDVYDALTTRRPYRRALSHQEALRLMTTSVAVTLDQELLSHFIAVLGYYPVGTLVVLSNRCTARVLEQCPSFPASPTVLEITSLPDGSPAPHQTLCDLSVNKGITIKGAHPDVSDDAIQAATRGYRPFQAAA